MSARYEERTEKRIKIYVGIDVHLRQWHVTVFKEQEELLSTPTPGSWEALRKLLERWQGQEMVVAYEAGFSGFWLHDALVSWGAECLVVPPTLIPREAGSRVKTDRRDSRKLAFLLSRGFLKRVWVPSQEERFDREVIRQRHRLVQDRRRLQCQLKALLHLYGLTIAVRPGRWSEEYIQRLWQVHLGHERSQESYLRLLERHDFVSRQLRDQTALVRDLATGERYDKSVRLLCAIPGIGVITAMELLTELGDLRRFGRADRLAAYVGLTPSQYSSGEHVRMGHITRSGKGSVRGMLVEAAWILIGKDVRMKQTYERIKQRAGGKRAIVAVARRLLLAVRQVLISGQPYQYQVPA